MKLGVDDVIICFRILEYLDNVGLTKVAYHLINLVYAGGEAGRERGMPVTSILIRLFANIMVTCDGAFSGPSRVDPERCTMN